MPEQGNDWLGKSSVLTADEIIQVATVAVAAGISTFRLTGGEPLLRTDVVDVVRRLAQLRGPSGAVDVAMTTNGIRLVNMLPDLVDAGLTRLNVSIDTLDRQRFHELTRRDRLDDVRAGIAAAARSDLRPLKLNAVAMRGVNDDELIDLVDFAVAHDAEMRFIEQMPLDANHLWNRQEMVTRDEILNTLSTRWHLEAVPMRGGAPAERFLIDGGPATVGVIASVTAPFCGDCHRARVSADGMLYTCLFAGQGHALRGVLARGEDALAARVADLWSKRADRYSEVRSEASTSRKHVEMYLVGG